MAKTYYKYKDRGQTIDYAGISKDFSQGIMETVTGMERKADEFSEEVRKAQEQVKKDVEDRFKQKRKAEGRSVTGEGDYKIELGEYDLPMGGERDANTVFVGLSTQASDRALEFKRQYQAQKLSPNEYLQKKNALDRTFRLMKESAISMNKLAEETAAGLKDGTIDPTQQLAFQELMSYNFTDPRVKIEIGDDGVGYMYRVDDKGNELPWTRKSIDQYRNMSIQRYEAYDFDSNSSDIVDKLGKTLETLGRRGMTTEELLKREPIMDSVNGGTLTPMDIIDDYAEGLDDDELASILMGQLGSQYSPTFNPEESVTEDASGNFTDDQSKILFVKRDLASGINKKTAQLTDEQRQRAQEFVRRDILSRFNVKPAPTTKPSAEQKKRAGYVKQATKEIEVLAKLFEAKSPNDVNEVLTTYSEQIQKLGGQDFQSARVVGDELVVEYLNPIVEEGEPKMLEKRFKMPRDNFKDFVMTIGPAITGDDRLSGLYDEAVAGADIDVDELVGGSSSGEFKITSPMPEFSEKEDVIMNQFDDLDSYLNESNRNKDYISVADKYFDEFDIDGEASVSPDGVMTITANGITETVKLHKIDKDDNKIELKSTRRTDLKNALKRIHNKLRKGATTTGGAAGDDILGS
jgi:hypothetical protein